VERRERVRFELEAGGNALMFAMTAYALKLLKGGPSRIPSLSTTSSLRKFTPTARRSPQPAAAANLCAQRPRGRGQRGWLLYAKENGITSFDGMIPEPFKPALSQHHAKAASIPLMAYTIPIEEIRRLRRTARFS
jgi:hypothetical protein